MNSTTILLLDRVTVLATTKINNKTDSLSSNVLWYLTMLGCLSDSFMIRSSLVISPTLCSFSRAFLPKAGFCRFSCEQSDQYHDGFGGKPASSSFNVLDCYCMFLPSAHTKSTFNFQNIYRNKVMLHLSCLHQNNVSSESSAAQQIANTNRIK